MPFYFFLWTEGNKEKLDQHGIDPDDFEKIVVNPDEVEESRSSDRLIAFGEDSHGRYVACVYELADDDSLVIPITAYPIED